MAMPHSCDDEATLFVSHQTTADTTMLMLRDKREDGITAYYIGVQVGSETQDEVVAMMAAHLAL
jgi:hypothetical protein